MYQNITKCQKQKARKPQLSWFTDDEAGNRKRWVTNPEAPDECATELDRNPGLLILPRSGPIAQLRPSQLPPLTEGLHVKCWVFTPDLHTKRTSVFSLKPNSAVMYRFIVQYHPYEAH